MMGSGGCDISEFFLKCQLLGLVIICLFIKKTVVLCFHPVRAFWRAGVVHNDVRTLTQTLFVQSSRIVVKTFVAIISRSSSILGSNVKVTRSFFFKWFPESNSKSYKPIMMKLGMHHLKEP